MLIRKKIARLTALLLGLACLGSCSLKGVNSPAATQKTTPKQNEAAPSSGEVATADPSGTPTITKIVPNLNYVKGKAELSRGHLLKITYENLTDRVFEYGEDIMLEKWDGQKWVTDPKVIPYRTIAYSLKSHGSFEETTDLNRHFGILPQGKYRLTKQMSEENSNFGVSTEFDIP